MKASQPEPIVNSRHLKILAAKKEDLKGCIVFVSLDKEKYGGYDVFALKKACEQIDAIQPDAIYVVAAADYKINFYDLAEFANRDVLVTVEYGESSEILDDDARARVEKEFGEILSRSRSLKFVHRGGGIEIEAQ